MKYDSDEDLLPEISGENWSEDVAIVEPSRTCEDWTKDLFCGDNLDLVCHLFGDEKLPENLPLGEKEVKSPDEEIVAYGLRKRNKKK